MTKAVASKECVQALTTEDFYAFMPMHSYIFTPTRDLWPAASVNARVTAPQGQGRASEWLDKNRAVEQMTWCPGESMIVADRLISQGGWIELDGCNTFNLYRPANASLGNSTLAGPWRAHIERVYSQLEADHIVQWCAHRVQHPYDKLNHALVLGGGPGIGKDSILVPLRHAIGPWNMAEIPPALVLGRFNDFIKSVVLHITEARDLGDVDRYAFYERMKNLIAAPPDVLRIDEKHLREYYVPNVTGVVYTTNHRTDGLYLPADDRRHFVAWSEVSADTFGSSYFRDLYRWYENGGKDHVAAYLEQLDLSSFDPKAPPPKTAAFWNIVDANRAPEDAELSDAIESLQNPDAMTLAELADRSRNGLAEWVKDRRNARQIPHRLEAAGYIVVRNDAAKDGLYKVGGKRQAVYVRADMSVRDRIAAARRFVEAGR